MSFQAELDLAVAVSDAEELGIELLSMKNLINRALKKIDSASNETRDKDMSLDFVRSELLQAKLLLREAME